MSERASSEADKGKVDKKKVDKKMAEGRTQRHALLFIWAVVATIGLVLVLCGQFQRRRAEASLDWPVVPGRIVTSEITSHTDEDGTTYSADIEYVYSVEGGEYRSNTVVFGGHSYGAHQAVSLYPLGKTVSVSYDPGKPKRAVLEPGVQSYELDMLGYSMIFGAVFMGTLINFLIRRGMEEERNLLDKILIITFKVIFFPLLVTKGNFWALGGMIGLATGLMLLDLHPVLTVGMMVFVAFFGIIWFLWAWIHFIGWLQEFVERSAQKKS